MYGRQQQPPPSYPRQYGQGYPQQQQQYPPQQQQQQQPQYGQQYVPQYAPQYGQPPQQQQQQYPPQQPASGAQYHGAPQPRGPYGHPAGPQQHAQAAAAPRGPTPYARPAAPPAVSSYESQAQRWKKGFSSAPGASGNGGAASGGGGTSRQSDIEAPLIAELCASAGSSYPPRDALQKLLRHLPSLDHQYLCELLDDKLEDRLWQVQGKALSVLDALFKSQEGETYKTYYYHKSYILEAICGSRKELLKARAEKIVNIVRSHAPPAPASPEYAQEPPREEPSLLLISPVLASAAAPAPVSAPPVNLLGSPMLMPQDEPAAVVGPAPSSASSAFGFLNAHASTPVAASEQPAVSAFSFLSAQQQVVPLSAPSAAQPPMTRVVGVSSAVAAPHVDIFSSLPPPTPVQGLVIPAPTPVPESEEQEDEDEEPPVHDPIHDAFEGLNFDDDDQDGDGNGNENGGPNDSNPLAGFSTTSRGTMGGSGAFAASAIKIEPSDPIREVNLEVDVPAGPMGLMLDRSIPHMAIVQGFLPMPTGERGYLEMHPVLCPGCALVSINSMSVEDKGLEEVGAILGSLVNSYKVLRFKKLLRSGRTVSPANPDVVYVPPPPEKPEQPPVEDKEQDEMEEKKEDQGDGEDAEDGSEFLRRLAEYSNQLDGVEQQIEEIVHRDRAHQPVGDMKNQLAQLHGNVEKIQTQGIDSVILGANPPSNADEIRQMRSALVRRSDALAKRIQKIVMHGTAPSPVVGAAQVAVGSPEVSAFSFVGGAGIGGAIGPGFPQMPSLQLPQPAPSAFSFMQATASPVNSPAGAAPMSGSAFSFLSAATPAPAPAPGPVPPPAVAATSTVFAGLSLRGNDDEATPTASVSTSAFSFMPSHATPVGVMEPPQVTSPTAFSFLRGATASPPVSPATAGPPGSAFSFIS